MAFKVRWNPVNRSCTNCGGSGKYTYTYNTRDCATCAGSGKVEGGRCPGCGGARRIPYETDCRACDGKGTVYLADMAKVQDKTRTKLVGLLKKANMELAGEENEFQIWERKPRAEDRPIKVVRRKRTAPVLSPPVFSFSSAAELAGMVSALANTMIGG